MAIQQRRAEDAGRGLAVAGRAGTGRALGSGEQGAATRRHERMARGLGWFSVYLGMAEVVAPRTVARLSGVPPRRGLVRAFGLREMASGVGILSKRRPTGWVWSRVAGDAVDLIALATALGSARSRRGRVLAATAAVAGVTALDVLTGRRLSRADGGATSDSPNGVRIRTAITIQRSADDIYRFWRDVGNLPGAMRHLESVQTYGERRSHWVARGPRGVRVEWDAEITEDRPGEVIAWRSLPGGDIETRGEVRFAPAPGGRGTEVKLDMEYATRAGVLGAGLGRLFGGAPAALVSGDLRPLKQALETGEVPTTEGQPSARRRDVAVRGGRR
jgi:uncharacterized membrane protein